MNQEPSENARLSPWWRQSVILVMVFGFTLKESRSKAAARSTYEPTIGRPSSYKA